MIALENRQEPGRPIVLIGPIRTGKSTIGELLASHLGRQSVGLDDHAPTYYAEIGYCRRESARRFAQGGRWHAYQYWKPFELHAVERVLQDYPNAVTDFGAGHSVYEEPALFDRAKKALARAAHVILLLPSPDPDISALMLDERLRAEQHNGATIDPSLGDLNRHFITHSSNFALATAIVYTAGRTPNQTCGTILKRLHAPG